MHSPQPPSLPLVSKAVEDVIAENFRFELENGKQNWPGGTSYEIFSPGREICLATLDKAIQAGCPTRADILLTQVYETFSKERTDIVREGLVLIASNAISWIEAIDAGVCK